MQKQRIVAWQPVLTDHQAYTLKAMAEASGQELIAYVHRMEDPVRRAQGWTDTRAAVYRKAIGGPLSCWTALRLLHRHRHDLHIFCSPFEQLPLMLCLFAAACCGLEVYMVSEPYSPIEQGYFSDGGKNLRRLKSRLRPWMYRAYGRVLSSRVQGVFAISRLAVEQYKAIGFRAGRVFPFGYFVPRESNGPNPDTGDLDKAAGAATRLVFVGALIERKGIDILIQAMVLLRASGRMDTHLDIYGPGQLPCGLTLPDGVRYMGTVAFGQAQTLMARYDGLILASRYDGWGVVVNEALLAGVPVLVSHAVGASVLVDNFGAGMSFDAEAHALATAIEAFGSDRERMGQMRQAAMLAGNAALPEVAGAHMWSTVRSVRLGQPAPIAPWYTSMP